MAKNITSRLPLGMAFALILLLASAFFLGGVQAACKDDYSHLINSFLINKGNIKRSRKLLEVDVMLDYEKPGPNPKHEGGRGRPIGGGLN